MRKKKIVVLMVLAILSMKVFAIPVEDPLVNGTLITKLLFQIEQLYNMYDRTMQNIESIQQRYEQLQFYVDRAANWKWEDVEWDGDLDFRNEITQATRNVDRELTNIRKIRNTLSKPTMSWGQHSFSIASLAGIQIDGQGNLADFVKEGEEYYDDGFKKAAKVWAEGMPEDEAAYLWAKYGLNPANYWMVRNVDKKLAEKTAYMLGLGEVTEESKQQEEERMKRIDNIMKMLKDSNSEDLTEGQIEQVIAMLQQQTIVSLSELQKSLEQAMSYQAWYNQLVLQKEEAERQSKMEKMKEAITTPITVWF